MGEGDRVKMNCCGTELVEFGEVTRIACARTRLVLALGEMRFQTGMKVSLTGIIGPTQTKLVVHLTGNFVFGKGNLPILNIFSVVTQ